MNLSNTKTREYGDFQTPLELTNRICKFLAASEIFPRSIIEPTCGKGNFLLSAIEHFLSIETGIGVDINSKYIEIATSKLLSNSYLNYVEIIQENFFEIDWYKYIYDLPEPLLVIGNLPWITNSSLGVLGSKNLPEKTNFQKYKGLDALTGKSNFDISEWMLIHILNWFNKKHGLVAMLCKNAVARKILQHASKNNLPLYKSSIYSIDTKKYFDASVDACLFVCHLGTSSPNYDCSVYKDIDNKAHLSTFGTRNGQSIANIKLFEKWEHLTGKEYYKWRSGIKHDCAKIMELSMTNNELKNGLGYVVNIENTHIFPLLKSSDIANNKNISRSVIITQKIIGEPTQHIQEDAPKT